MLWILLARIISRYCAAETVILFHWTRTPLKMGSCSFGSIIQRGSPILKGAINSSCLLKEVYYLLWHHSSDSINRRERKFVWFDKMCSRIKIVNVN